MFKNQYLISNKRIECNLCEIKWNNMHIYINDIYQVAKEEYDNKAIMILGVFFNPIDKIYKTDEIAKKILKKSESIDEVINELAYISGRYIVLFYDNCKNYIISDALGMKNVFYYYDDDNNFYITSNPKMFEDYNILNIEVPDKIKEIMQDWKFKRREMDWKSDFWYDTRIKQLIANHYLDIQNKKAIHVKYFLKDTYKKMKKEEITKKVIEILKNSIEILTKEYKCRLGITGGYDSRVLLAASEEYKEKIEFYTYKFKRMNPLDYKIARKLCNKIGVKHNLNYAKKLSKEFLNNYKQENKFPRILNKTRNIQWAYDNLKNDNYININGNAFNVVYSEASWKEEYVDKIMQDNEYYEKTYKKLKNEIKKFSKESNIPFGSISIWEIRGLWVNQFPREQDIAIEEITPFDNRIFIYLCNLIDQEIKTEEYKKLNVELIRKMNPNLLEVEFSRNLFKEKVKYKIKSLIKKVVGY